MMSLEIISATNTGEVKALLEMATNLNWTEVCSYKLERPLGQWSKTSQSCLKRGNREM